MEFEPSRTESLIGEPVRVSRLAVKWFKIRMFYGRIVIRVKRRTKMFWKGLLRLVIGFGVGLEVLFDLAYVAVLQPLSLLEFRTAWLNPFKRTALFIGMTVTAFLFFRATRLFAWSTFYLGIQFVRGVLLFGLDGLRGLEYIDPEKRSMFPGENYEDPVLSRRARNERV